MITTHGVVARKADCIRALPREYMDSLKHVYAPRVGPPRRCTIYKSLTQRNGIEIFVLPRDSIAPLRAGAVALRCALQPARPIAAPLDNPPDFLYEDQRAIVAHIARILRADPEGMGTASLNLRAGYGKTFVAAGLIAMMGMRTLVVVSTCELARQCADDFEVALDHVVYAQSVVKFREARDDAQVHVCIVVINTLLLTHDGDIDANARAFSLVVFDEIHTYCTGKRLEVFWQTQTRYMFGMSATIGDRRDGFDFAVAHHFAPLVDAADVPGFAYGDSGFKVLVRCVRFKARAEFAQNLRHETTGEVFTHYMYEQFARDDERCAIVIEEARALFDAGHNTFIFTEERAFAEKICALLSGSGWITRDEVALFYGGADEEDRARAIGSGEIRARIIVATYSYSGTGVSIVRMTAAILATPRYSNMKQIVGRILRRGSDVAIERVVVDIIDVATCLAKQHRLRKNAYDFYSARYETVKKGR